VTVEALFDDCLSGRVIAMLPVFREHPCALHSAAKMTGRRLDFRVGRRPAEIRREGSASGCVCRW
jgi:hypothetical protein